MSLEKITLAIKKKKKPSGLSSRKDFAILLADFDFATRWTKIEIRANSAPVSHAFGQRHGDFWFGNIACFMVNFRSLNY